MRSIERTLLAWTLGALTLGAVLVVLATYAITLDELDEVFDAELRNVAEALGTHQRSVGPSDRLAPRSERPPHADPAEIVTITWSADGRLVFSSAPATAIPFSRTERLERLRVAGEDWVVYTDVNPNGVAQAAQRLAARRLSAAESALQIALPMLLLVASVGALLLMALRRGLRPLDRAAHAVAGRSAASLTPIGTEAVPAEVLPLVQAINGLMQRLSAAFAGQQQFMADAAHELRSPVTALRLQLQLLQRATDDASRAEAVAELRAGIDRAQHLIEQLIDVARFGPEGAPAPHGPVDLADLVRQQVGRLSAKAAQLQIDLGARAEHPVLADGNAGQLQVLLSNLVENALRYTPAGGLVDVSATWLDGRPALLVVDNGPGIPAAERAHVFGRFHRGAEAQALARDGGGCGLGLAIVQAIADLHQAKVSLHDAPGGSGSGLEVRVVFPGGPKP